MALGPRGWGLGIAVAVAGCLWLHSAAFAQEAVSELTVTAHTPNAEFRIRGVSLRSVRADDSQNTVAFDFNGPVSDAAFAKLQDELPDWIAMAYAGYDNAIIRAKRPVTFMARAESDGFSMRLVPRDDGAPAGAEPIALRGADDAALPPATAPLFTDIHGWQQVANYFARATAERPYDVSIRGFYDAQRDGGANFVDISGDWRHTRGSTLYTSNAHAAFEAWSGVGLLADVQDADVNAKAVRQLDGTIAPYNHNNLSGSVGVSVPLDSATATAELLNGRSGFGGRVGVGGTFDDWRFGMRAAYHEPYTDTAEAVAARADRDYSALFAAGQIFDGLWGAARIQGTRYGVHGDIDVAHTAGFHAGLRYDFGGWPVSLTYDGDGEYVIGSHTYAGDAPTLYVPLSIHNREVHQFGGAFSEAWDDAVWFDLYGGYAVDRYSNEGPYGGAALRFTPGPSFDIALNGRYSTVADYQGERGETLSGGLTLTYAFGGDAPILHGGSGAAL